MNEFNNGNDLSKELLMGKAMHFFRILFQPRFSVHDQPKDFLCLIIDFKNERLPTIILEEGK